MPAPAGVIRGSRSLPPAYDHRHASEEARRIAERGTVLRAGATGWLHRSYQSFWATL